MLYIIYIITYEYVFSVWFGSKIFYADAVIVLSYLK